MFLNKVLDELDSVKILTVLVQRLVVVQHSTTVDEALHIGRNARLGDDVLFELAHRDLQKRGTI